MATQKKTTSEMDILRAEESLTGTSAAAAKAKATRVGKAPGATAEKRATAKPAGAAKSAAATHKAPARKSGSVEAEAPAEFDVAAHHEEISVAAYHHWLHRGAPHGSDQHDWLAAIEIVRARYRA